MSGTPPRGPRRRRLPAGRARLARLPGGKEVARFLAQLRYPTRVSAVRAAVDGVVVASTLTKRGVRPLLGTVGTSPTTIPDPHRSKQVADAVDAGLGLIPVAPTCLRRSVTLIRELNRLGLAATMHVGVRNVGERAEAHAWVQAGDVVVNDDPSVTTAYAELAAGDLERLVPLLR